MSQSAPPLRGEPPGDDMFAVAASAGLPHIYDYLEAALMDNTYNSTREYWQSRDAGTEEELAHALRGFFILFASQNCLLEDMEVSPKDVVTVFQGRGGAADGPERLLQNQKDCFDSLLPKAAAGEPLTTALLYEVNEMLADGVDAEPDEDDDAFLTPEELREALDTLVSEINAYNGPDALKAAAYFEAKLEYLQPFSTLCGLTARVLVSHFLLTRGEPPLVFFEKDAERYFDALESYDIGEDIVPMQKLMREETVETWKTLLAAK